MLRELLLRHGQHLFDRRMSLLSLWQEIVLVLTLMVTSKGIAGRSSGAATPAICGNARRRPTSSRPRGWTRTVRSPSATASARFAKSTVAQRQTVTDHANTDGFTIASAVVYTEAIHTTKTTGWRICVRGSSFATARGSAERSSASEKAERRFGAAVTAFGSDGVGVPVSVFVTG